MRNPSLNPHFRVIQMSGSTPIASHRFLTPLTFHASPGRKKQVPLCISLFRPGESVRHRCWFSLAPPQAVVPRANRAYPCRPCKCLRTRVLLMSAVVPALKVRTQKDLAVDLSLGSLADTQSSQVDRWTLSPCRNSEKFLCGNPKDIEVGLVNPSELSVVYQYEAEGARRTSTDVGSWVGRKSSSDPRRSTNFITLYLPVLLIGLAVKWFLSMKEKEKEDPLIREKDIRLMQMRKLKAQMSREASEETGYKRPQDLNGGSGVSGSIRSEKGTEKVQDSKEVLGEIISGGHPPVHDEEFQRKVVEIRALARKARLQEQESAEARSAQSFERKKSLQQGLQKDRSRVHQLENLAEDLDKVRRLGAETSDGPDFMATAMESVENKTPKSENGQSLTLQPRNEQPGSADSSLENSSPGSPNLSSPAGVKPRIILSAKEARANIAARRARLSSSSSSLKPGMETSKLDNPKSFTDSRTLNPPVVETSDSANGTDPRGLEDETIVSARNIPVVLPEKPLGDPERGFPAAGDRRDSLPQAEGFQSVVSAKTVVASQTKSTTESDSVNLNKQAVEGMRQEGTPEIQKIEGNGQNGVKEEEEEMEWMRDDVLREIVFKVQANEEAGRDTFHNLNSKQETLFFKGLERKFEREGEKVKKWIKDRVENIDYGLDGISLYDPPESYELKWKEGVPKSQKSDFYKKFSEDRKRMLDEYKGMNFNSQDDLGERSPSPSPPPSPISSSPVSPTNLKESKTPPGSRERTSGNGKTKSVIASSPRPNSRTIFPGQPTIRSTDNGENGTGKENWDNTKKWAKDLERKYQMERDPATKALMLEIGQDLERWITEDEIEQANKLLDQGVEGEQEYVRIHYEKIKEKIKLQQESFGRDAMLDKYSEYKPKQEIELWWLDLPYVVCIGLQRTVDGELQAGLYSVDVTEAMEGVPGKPSDAYHTVAFQDRGDAQNFWKILSTQPENVGAERVELIPFDPKELYQDAKAEGYKVTVIKKGQLQLSVDHPFEEVESLIVEISSAKYYDKVLHDRTIDMESVLDEGLGYGQPPQL